MKAVQSGLGKKRYIYEICVQRICIEIGRTNKASESVRVMFGTADETNLDSGNPK